MIIQFHPHPVLKMAVAMEHGDVIRYKADEQEHWNIAIYDRCYTAKNGVATEIHVKNLATQLNEKIYDTECIANVSFEVIGVVEQWH